MNTHFAHLDVDSKKVENNEALLNDPLYLGYQKPRVTGADYDDFIEFSLWCLY